jgi:hypothetical protein
MLRRLFPSLLILAILDSGSLRADDVTVDPAAVKLSGPGASYSLLIHGKAGDGRLFDLTRSATYHSQDPKIAAVSATGIIRGVADGKTQIVIAVKGQKKTVAVDVSESTRPRQFHFENDIVPLFSRFGCNSSGCHGSSLGQNGFKLSVFGFDPLADHAALTKEDRGRRVLYSSPESSLLLRKPSGSMPHGGGIRIPPDSFEFETIRGWIAAGTPMGDPKAPHVTGIRVEPAERQLDMKGQQQLRVIARWSDNREVDVTAHAKFQTNNEGLASVSADGLVSAGQVAGEAAIMAGYMGSVAVFRALVPRAEKIADYPRLPENNFIDALVIKKLKKLNIVPSELADDADYLRRVYLDVIGTLPTPAESRKFLADKSADRRTRLVDDLLQRPEFADYWALKWADLLRVDRQVLGHKGAYGYYRWIRESNAKNKPLDQFAREIVAAEGPLAENGPANFYKVVAKPGDRASTLSQVFLGLRIACAECHHHPFDRWSQTDYYGMQAFFAPLTLRPGDVLLASGQAQAKHPRTGQIILPNALGTQIAKIKDQNSNKTQDSKYKTQEDPRTDLAIWFTSPENPWFARNLANRTWAHFLGRGLVEPVDDVRDTNPPSNPELLDALSKQLIDSKFDFKKLIRMITASRVYQQSAKPNATNEKDELNYSRALFRRIDAEVLLDMVSQTTGVQERFPGTPAGYRAIQLWDSKVPHYFLKLFGRPVRASACECERNTEPGVSQILHLLNSPGIQAKLSHERGTVAKLVRSKKDAEMVEELYLIFFCRYPTESERTASLQYLTRHADNRRQAAEDVAWSLLNSLEFVFNH